MPVPSSMPPLAALRSRLDALPLDRAPLRRAGLLTVLLVILLVVGKALGPGRPAPASAAGRQDVRTATEEVSAPSRPRGWTGGRVLALVLLAAGGGFAFVLHRRSGSSALSPTAVLDVLETHPLGPGQSLRLVACGDEVLLLSVGADGARLLRHWPRERFDREAVSFADALAEATCETAPTEASRVDKEDSPLVPSPCPSPGGRGDLVGSEGDASQALENLFGIRSAVSSPQRGEAKNRQVGAATGATPATGGVPSPARPTWHSDGPPPLSPPVQEGDSSRAAASLHSSCAPALRQFQVGNA